MTKKTILIGLGNTLMADEGIGIHIVQELARRRMIPEGVETRDLGPGGLRVLHECDGFDKAVFVDCGFTGKDAGALVRFTPEEARTVKVRPRQSLHEGDLFETLELARKMDQLPQEVVIFAVEPDRIEIGEELSSALQDRVDVYVEAVRQELHTTSVPHQSHA